jgi:hypothetical protein
MQDTIPQVVETRTAELQREAVRLRGERAAIEERLAEIEGELGELEIAVRVYRRFSNGAPSVGSPASPLDLGAEPERATLPDLSRMSLADAAATVLRVQGNGALSRDLRRVLTEAGKLPPGRNSYGYLLKVLRDKPERFVKDQTTSTWSLREGSA